MVLYACEATWPNKCILNCLDRLVNQAVSKIFHTCDPNDVQYIRSVVGLDTIQVIAQKCQMKFVNRLE